MPGDEIELVKSLRISKSIVEYEKIMINKALNTFLPHIVHGVTEVKEYFAGFEFFVNIYEHIYVAEQLEYDVRQMLRNFIGAYKPSTMGFYVTILIVDVETGKIVSEK